MVRLAGVSRRAGSIEGESGMILTTGGVLAIAAVGVVHALTSVREAGVRASGAGVRAGDARGSRRAGRCAGPDREREPDRERVRRGE